MSEDFKNATTTGHFKFGFEEFFLERNYREAASQRVPKAPFSKCFLSTRKQKAGVLGFSNSFGLKSVFEKLHFRDGFAWTVDQTVDCTKLRFQIPQVWSERALSLRHLFTITV